MGAIDSKESRTGRLLLVKFEPDDLAAMHAFSSNPAVTHRTWRWPNSLDDTSAFLREVLARNEEPNPMIFDFAIRLIDGGQLIGGCYIEITSLADYSGELGLMLGRQHWGRGYGTEVACGLVAVGFRLIGLHRLSAMCRPDNVAYRRVLEHAGLQLEGRLRHHRLFDDGWHDSLLLAKLNL